MKNLMIGLMDEHENGALYFNIDNNESVEMFIQYIKDNIERNEEYKFILKEMSDVEVVELGGY